MPLVNEFKMNLVFGRVLRITNYGYHCTKKFTTITGRAFLFHKVVNLVYSEVQDRVMLTGRHMVRDVSCKNCSNKLGWVYEFATEENQRYIIGPHLNKVASWVPVCTRFLFIQIRHYYTHCCGPNSVADATPSQHASRIGMCFNICNISFCEANIMQCAKSVSCHIEVLLFLMKTRCRFFLN